MLKTKPSDSDHIRDHVIRKYVESARAQGRARFSVQAGVVEREMRSLGLLKANRTPQFLSALRARKFWEANGLRLVSEQAPPTAPSGQSTSVVLTFAFVDREASPPPPPEPRAGIRTVFSRLRDMAGMAHAMYQRLGGPEKALQDERSGYAP